MLILDDERIGNSFTIFLVEVTFSRDICMLKLSVFHFLYVAEKPCIDINLSILSSFLYVS